MPKTALLELFYHTTLPIPTDQGRESVSTRIPLFFLTSWSPGGFLSFINCSPSDSCTSRMVYAAPNTKPMSWIYYRRSYNTTDARYNIVRVVCSGMKKPEGANTCLCAQNASIPGQEGLGRRAAQCRRQKHGDYNIHSVHFSCLIIGYCISDGGTIQYVTRIEIPLKLQTCFSTKLPVIVPAPMMYPFRRYLQGVCRQRGGGVLCADSNAGRALLL